MRRALDGLYWAGGVLGALCLIAILVLVCLQMLARWTGEVAPGVPEYAGYFMAASAFFAFAYALNKGAHIRVNLLLSALGAKRRWAEIWCFAVGSALACYLAYFACNAVYWSMKLGDVSQGQDATPLWIPQSAMAIGSILLAIAMIDNLISLIRTGDHNLVAARIEAKE